MSVLVGIKKTSIRLQSVKIIHPTDCIAFITISRGHPLSATAFHPAKCHCRVVTELLKAQTNAGQKPSLYFLRDKEGREIDALIETSPNVFQAVEIKSGETIASDSFDGLTHWRNQLSDKTLVPWLVHGGTAHQQREKATVLPWNDLSPLRDRLMGPS